VAKFHNGTFGAEQKDNSKTLRLISKRNWYLLSI